MNIRQWFGVSACLLVFSGCSELPNNKNITQVCFKNKCVKVKTVWTVEGQQRGLQHVKDLPMDEGMLFVFDEEKKHRFWMKDTLISLDIIWINHYREIVNMAIFVPPCKKDPCPLYVPPEDSISVLELNAGKSEYMGFEPGDRLTFKK